MMHSPIALRLPEAVVEQIDAIVATRMDQPDRSAVIRELIVEALAAREKKGRRV
jgi:Arc/MetJ-type ribon-helix-helix transcriptional regulator